MRKSTLFTLLIILLMASSSTAYAHQETVKNFTEAKQLVDSKTDCSGLTDTQLEQIGEYLMEQMHPGESHDQMHAMMGLGEGTEKEEQFHINMAKSMYCHEPVNGTMGMMGNMMDHSMMHQGQSNPITGNLISSVPFNILIIALTILVVLAIIKLSKGLFKK